jgi:hypothetical protein
MLAQRDHDLVLAHARGEIVRVCEYRTIEGSIGAQ